MRIVARIVQRDGNTTYLCPTNRHTGHVVLTRDADRASIFPCESYAQDAIDGFMVGRPKTGYYTDIIDLDDPERGSLEPLWTGP